MYLSLALRLKSIKRPEFHLAAYHAKLSFMSEAETHNLTGRCACGAVTFVANATKTYGVCHCKMCRRWCGGVWMGVRTTKSPQIEGPVKIWKSSKLADRAICENCGSAIWHRPLGTDKPVLGQGLFDDQVDWSLNRQIFVDSKPDHYGFGDTGKIMTGWAAIWTLLTGKMPK